MWALVAVQTGRHRGRGRHDHPVHVVWAVVPLRTVLRHVGFEAVLGDCSATPAPCPTQTLDGTINALGRSYRALIRGRRGGAILRLLGLFAALVRFL